MAVTFERADLERALDQLVSLLVEGDRAASVRIVGGAAIALAYFDRSATVDIDAFFAPREDVLAAVVQLADENGWPADWLNDKFKGFASHYDQPDDWRPLIERGDVAVFVASPELLLAMKLHASRGRRDHGDINGLLDLRQVGSVDEAVEIFNRYYPEEAIKARGVAFLEERFS